MRPKYNTTATCSKCKFLSHVENIDIYHCKTDASEAEGFLLIGKRGDGLAFRTICSLEDTENGYLYQSVFEHGLNLVTDPSVSPNA